MAVKADGVYGSYPDCLAVTAQMNTMKLEARGNSALNWDPPFDSSIKGLI